MQHIVIISYSLFDTFNFIVNYIRVLNMGKVAKLLSENKEKGAQLRNTAGTAGNSVRTTLRPAHFYTNYNDILVSSIKGI